MDMRKYRAEGFGWDFNGTLVTWHTEFWIFYCLLLEYVKRFDVPMFFRACFKTQAKCLKYFINSEIDRLAAIILSDIFSEEDEEFLTRYLFDNPMEKRFSHLLRGIPVIGKKLDTQINREAVAVAEELSENGVLNFIYTASFLPIVEGAVKRCGSNAFVKIYGNPVKIEGIAADYLFQENSDQLDEIFYVNPMDKSKTFQRVLEETGLKITGEGVGYVGDSEQDRRVFAMVEYPFVSPFSKEEFREECRYDPDFGDRITVLREYGEILKKLERRYWLI
ncbi:MAG TPA: hypothetical protein ENG00_00195 [Candidatus Aenigmarchaeota archaeon]|nr:hypothetical protein [Candidatus Aenigmarchaeota archaeon]